MNTNEATKEFKDSIVENLESDDNKRLLIEKVQNDFFEQDNNSFWAYQQRLRDYANNKYTDCFKDFLINKSPIQWWVYVHYFKPYG